MKEKIKNYFITFNKKSFFWTLGNCEIGAVILWIVILAIKELILLGKKHSNELSKIFKLWSFKESFTNQISTNIVILISLILIGMIIAVYYGFKHRNKNKAMIKRAKTSEYGDSRFLLDVRSKTDSGTGANKPKNIKEFNQQYIPSIQEPFWLTSSEYKNGVINYTGVPMSLSPNCLVVGSVGSYKTKKVIEPQIILNARINDKSKKPSMIIGDVKGELYRELAGELQESGYEVRKFDLKDTTSSDKFNFLSTTYKYFVDGLNYESDNITFTPKEELNDKCKCYAHGVSKCSVCIETAEKVFVDNKTDTFFANNDEKDKYVYRKKELGKSNANKQINNILDVLFSSGNEGQNKSFYDGGKAIVKATMLLLLEIKEQYPDSFDENQYNMPTILALVANQSKLTFMFLQWGQKFETSTAWITGAGVFQASENSRANYFSYAKSGLARFEDEDLRTMLIKSEINLFNISNPDRPVALFLIIPDAEPAKHPLAVMMINQLYQTLMNQADESKNGKLGRPVQFVLDEFGQLPQTPEMDTKISAARSRNVGFQMVLQSFQQLSRKYSGMESTIKSNSELWIYLKTNDSMTLQDISKQIGQQTTEAVNTSVSDNHSTISTSIKGSELMNTTTIKNLPLKYSVLLFTKNFPSIVKFTPAFKMGEDGEDIGLNKPIKMHNKIEIIDFYNHYFFDLFSFYNEKINPDNESIIGNTKTMIGIDEKSSTHRKKTKTFKTNNRQNISSPPKDISTKEEAIKRIEELERLIPEIKLQALNSSEAEKELSSYLKEKKELKKKYDL